MRHLHNQAQMGMVGAAIGLFITLLVSIIIYYNIAGAIDTTTIDTKFGYSAVTGNGSSPALNATTSIGDQAATFYTIAPIVAIVIVAVVVIGYVQKIGG